MTSRSDLFPRDPHDEDEDRLDPLTRPRRRPETPGLPATDDLTGEVPTAPGPDLTPARTEEVEPPPGTVEHHGHPKPDETPPAS
ncbi:hypothetical protein [Amycolatopsis jiangsuensis]|uniref:Uncharacterized protein n=1 Tax=Amycolatopsis jiangsuensis TaxID=1181879 RepID=A0A840INP4_9PSEU|nr:hypothetical protein [Amycolatopsis jiangsuensis]MBB4682828.1 hypothetical protein [Amycolatopsis jiangsuensis]